MIGRRTIPGFLLGLMVSPALAQTPNMISFQGLIKDNLGNLITVPVNLEFRIYDALTLGNLVDTDGDGVVEDVCGQDVTCVPAVTPTDGIVVTKFGPIRATAFDGTDRFLEVTVDGSPLSRIEMVTAVAAANQLNIPPTGSPAVIVDELTGKVKLGVAPGAEKGIVEIDYLTGKVEVGVAQQLGDDAQKGIIITNKPFNPGVAPAASFNTEVRVELAVAADGAKGIIVAPGKVDLGVAPGAEKGIVAIDELTCEVELGVAPGGERGIIICCLTHKVELGVTPGGAKGISIVPGQVDIGVTPGGAKGISICDLTGKVDLGVAPLAAQGTVTVDSFTGRVGIGTSSPDTKLVVMGTVSASGFAGTSPLIFEAPAGTERMRIDDTNGNVGIGTTTPSEKLDVAGNVKASGTLQVGSTITHDGNSTPNTISSDNAVGLELHVSSGRALRLESNATSPNVIGGHSSNTQGQRTLSAL